MEEIKRLWDSLREKLAEAVERNDFSFLNVLGLGPRQSKTFQKVLQFAVAQKESLPKLPGLSTHDKGNIKPYHLHDLKRKGFLTRTSGALNSWELTLLGLRGLDDIPQELLRKPAGRNSKQQKNPNRALSGKIKAVYDYLEAERVGEELLLTLDRRQSLAANLGVRMDYLRQIFNVLEGKGLVQKKPASNGTKGDWSLVFTKKEAPKSTPASRPTVPQMLGGLQEEIQRHQADVARLTEDIRIANETIEKKTLVMQEIRRLAGVK